MRDGDDANLCHKLPEFALLDWSVGNARTGEWIDARREGQRREERVLCFAMIKWVSVTALDNEC